MKKGKTLLALLIAFSSGQLIAQKVEINKDASSIEWLGKKIGGEHSGTIDLKSASLDISDDAIAGGSFEIDMSSIKNTDISDETYNQKLVGHLKSDDFFGVEKYPTAKFEIIEGGKFIDGKATLRGELTIKGNTEEMSFDVFREDNMLKTKLDIDRSKFNVRYGSNSFFDNLGDKAISDIFSLEIKLATKNL